MPEPELGRIVQLTNETNRYVYSAIADWIYEEEILASEKAFWWSKDGTRIAYAQFNDTLVEFQEFPWYGDSINHDTQYLDQVKIKYPKVSQKHKAHRSIVVNWLLTNLERREKNILTKKYKKKFYLEIAQKAKF